jgi:hypothetical protein
LPFALVERNIEAAFGFVADPCISTKHNASNYLATMPLWLYFQRPTTMDFHELTTRLKPPKNLRSLLGLNLKFVPNPRTNVPWRTYSEEVLPRFDRDLKVKIVMQNLDEDESYNPNLYVKSDWIPPNVMLPRCIPGRLQAFRHAIQRAVKTKKSPSNLLRHQRHALDALRNQIDFLIVQCDKNLGPYVIEHVEYLQMAIRDHLSDNNTYRRLSRFEATLAAGQIRLAVKYWIVRHKEVLTKNERKFISHCINTNKVPFAAFYLNMKVHKTTLKSCPIVSCSGSLLFALGKWVDDKLKICAHRQPDYFKSIQDLQTMLSKMVIPPHTFFFTADAESMYTNIDTNRALAYISSYIQDHAAEFEFCSVEALIEALKIFMKNNIFTFGDTYWRQDSGTAMGTQPAPQWANIFYALCEN